MTTQLAKGIVIHLASLGPHSRFYLLCRTKFIAWCLVHPIRGMPTSPRIFAPVWAWVLTYTISLLYKVIVSYSNMVGCWINTSSSLARRTSHMPLVTHPCTPCKINSFHCKLRFVSVPITHPSNI